MLSEVHKKEIRRINAGYMDHDFWGSMNEEISLAIYVSVLQPGDVAIDCGVNRGDHTKVMARRCGSEGRVYAFEAVPDMMQKAQRATLGLTNINWIQKAVWETAGQEVDFYFYPNEDGLSSIRPANDVSVCVPIKATTSTIDDEVSGHVSLIKLDIEGAEYHALRGARRVVEACRPIIVFENNRNASAERFGYSKGDFFDFFHEYGYFLYSINGMPFTEDLWGDVAHPWQFIALHPMSPRLGRVFAVTNFYLSCISALPMKCPR